MFPMASLCRHAVSVLACLPACLLSFVTACSHMEGGRGLLACLLTGLLVNLLAYLIACMLACVPACLPDRMLANLLSALPTVFVAWELGWESHHTPPWEQDR